MPFNIPSLSQLQSQTQTDIETRIPGSAPTLRRSFLGAIGAALAGVAKGLYGYLSWLGIQAVPATATEDNLDRWASIWGIYRKQPTSAEGDTVSITDAAPSTLIPTATSLSSTFGQIYVTQEDVTTDGSGDGTLAVTATAVGAAGNLPVGAVLTFVSPIFGIPTTATVGGDGINGGSDLESDDALRARTLQRIQNPPHGGNAADYVGWAESVAGITRAWCFPLYSGAGTVEVFIANDSYSGSTLASSGDVTNVQDYINSVCPVTATVTVAAPTVTAVDFTLAISPDTTDNRAAITAALSNLFLAEAEPEGSVSLNHMIANISNALEGGDFTMTVPSSEPTAASGHILTMGTITWT